MTKLKPYGKCIMAMLLFTLCVNAQNKVAAPMKDVNKVIDNTLDSSIADNYANKIGRLLGKKYPNKSCDTLIQKYIKKHYK